MVGCSARRRRRGSGSVYRRRSGSWAAQYSQAGLKVRRVFRVAEDAEAWLVAAIAANRPDLGWDYQGFPKPFAFQDRPSARRAISLSTRFVIFERDGFRCHYCGAAAPDVRLVVDHVVPVVAGGSHDASNLVAACEECNLGKGSYRVLG